MHWLAGVHRQTVQKLQILRSGNGGENTSCEMSSFLKDRGILREKMHFIVPIKMELLKG